VPIIRQQMSVMVRERRHLRLSLLLSCQDPGGLPAELLPLLDMVGVFHHESEEWNRTLAKAIAAFQIVKVDLTSVLKTGQMVFWARQWFQLADGYDWKEAPIIVEVRPRASQHGGHTEESVRQTA
jgi:hypothetical protein